MREIQMSLQAPKEMVQEKLDTLHGVHTSIVSAIEYAQRTLESTRREELITLTDVLQTKCVENLEWMLPEDDTKDTRIILSFQGQRGLEELIDTFGGLASSLNVDEIPDKQPTLQDLQKWNMQLTLKEENMQLTLKQENMQLTLREEYTRMVHKVRWRQLGDIIHRITAGTVPRPSESPGLQRTSQEVRPEQVTTRQTEPEPLTSRDVFEAAKHFISRAFVPSETLGGGLYLTGYSGTIHIISCKERGSEFITCPKLHLDAGRANTCCCHVTTDGELVNSPPATQHMDRDRRQRLSGTHSSNPIPLSPSSSAVTPVLPTTRYWEAHTRVGVLSRGWWPILEVGVGKENQVDSKWYACLQRRSWCVNVLRCDTHPGSLCNRVCLAGVWGRCYRNTMSDTPGSQDTLHYGVVLDVRRGRIGFIDVDRSVVLGQVDVKFKGGLLNVFTVNPTSHYTVNMKVFSGEEILISDTKKSLISEALA